MSTFPLSIQIKNISLQYQNDIIALCATLKNKGTAYGLKNNE